MTDDLRLLLSELRCSFFVISVSSSHSIDHNSDDLLDTGCLFDSWMGHMASKYMWRIENIIECQNPKKNIGHH